MSMFRFVVVVVAVGLVASCGKKEEAPVVPATPQVGAVSPAAPAPAPDSKAEVVVVKLHTQTPEKLGGQVFQGDKRSSNTMYYTDQAGTPFKIVLPDGSALELTTPWGSVSSSVNVLTGTNMSLAADKSLGDGLRALREFATANSAALPAEVGEKLTEWEGLPAEEQSKTLRHRVKLPSKVTLVLEVYKGGDDWRPQVQLTTEHDDMVALCIESAKAWAVRPDHVLELSESSTSSLAFSRDGKQLAVGKNVAFHLVDMASLEVKTVGRIGDTWLRGSYGVSYSEAGDLVTLHGDGNRLILLDPAKPEIVEHTEKAGGSMRLLPNGNGYVKLKDKAARWVDAGGFVKAKFEGELEKIVGGVSPDSTRIVMQVDRRTFALYDITTGKRIADLEGVSRIDSTSFPTDSAYVAGVAFMGAKEITLWDCATGKKLKSLPSQVHNRVAVSPDGSMVVGASWGSPWGASLDLFEVESGKLIAELGRTKELPGAVLFSPDNKRLVVATANNNKLFIWDLAKLK